MTEIPHDSLPDSTVALIADPYRFISRRCRDINADLFECRFALRKTICMYGAEACKLFYDESRFTREGVAPPWLQETLVGKGGVQGLDGEEHKHRKQMFLSLMSQSEVSRLGEITVSWWRQYADQWAKMSEVVLYDELHELLTRAVCAWAGVFVEEHEMHKRSEELTAMFDQATALGPGHVWSRIARNDAEDWIAAIIERVRAGELKPQANTALDVIANHRDLAGKPLDSKIAAVELINVLRPTVAVSVFVLFAALALHQYPECLKRLRSSSLNDGYVEMFAQEVRRFYPFFPAVLAKTRKAFEWHGYSFPEGQQVALDLYGTNHDPRIWTDPEVFRPERFKNWDGNLYTFIPQGGGDVATNHRCPGEWIAKEIISVSVDFLSKSMTYKVPEQDLEIDYGRMPALPNSRLRLVNVQVL